MFSSLKEQAPQYVGTYDQEPLGYAGVISLKRPNYFSPAANSSNNPNTDALTSFKVTPFKLGRDSGIPVAQTEKDVELDEDGWGSTDPK
jgi:hypothetical protein